MDGWMRDVTENQTCSNVYLKALDEARPVVSWLRQQPRVNGGYSSTQVRLLLHSGKAASLCVATPGCSFILVPIGAPQATMMVYQAVAEYSPRAKEKEAKDFGLNVNVLMPGRPQLNRYSFNSQNYHFTRTETVSSDSHCSGGILTLLTLLLMT